MLHLFSTKFGSKLYGTQTPMSDTDIKHIVLPDLDDILLGKKIENKVKNTNKETNVKNSIDDIDEEFIPIQTFAKHFLEGQTYALELAFAIEGSHADQKIVDARIVKFIEELRANFLTSNIKSMVGYVVNQASLYSFKGERLNVTRELLEIISNANDVRAEGSIVTLDNIYNSVMFSKQLEDLQVKYPKYFRKDVYDVGGGQMKPCLIILEKTLPFTNSIEQTLKVLNSLKNKYGTRADQASINNVDWKATMHALRIVDEGLKLLSEHKLEFPLEDSKVERLLSIKRGEVSITEIAQELSEKLDILKEMENTTTLKKYSQELIDSFDVWLVSWLREFYNLK